MPTALSVMNINKLFTLLTYLLIAYLFTRLGLNIIQSFSWPMDGDLNFLYYMSWLMNEHDMVPYKDLHETSIFGTFIFYNLLTATIGYSPLSFHIADTVLFIFLGLMTFYLLKPIGKSVALITIALFGEYYYQLGPSVHLQRDYIALFPVVLALLLSQQQFIGLHKRAFIVGTLFAVAACIKPQFGLGAAPAVILLYLQSQEGEHSFSHLLKLIAISLAGFMLILFCGFAWLASLGVMNNFLDMFFNYLPLYSKVNGRNYARMNSEALSGAFHWIKGTLIFALPHLILSFYRVYTGNKQAPLEKSLHYFLIFLIVIWFFYLCYVPMAGKYWGYHILPSQYFWAILISLFFVPVHLENNRQKIIHSGALLLWLALCWLGVLLTSFSPVNKTQMAAYERTATTTAELTQYLKENLRPDDRIQPHVTHTLGPIFPALLAAQAKPASPYLEIYLLYHDIDTPFVQQARQNFMSMLEETPPRYIVMTPNKFSFRGDNTNRQFLPFEEWLAKHYHVVLRSSQMDDQKGDEIFILYKLNH